MFDDIAIDAHNKLIIDKRARRFAQRDGSGSALLPGNLFRF